MIEIMEFISDNKGIILIIFGHIGMFFGITLFLMAIAILFQ